GKVLKEHFKNVRIYAVEPEDAAVLSGEEPRPHMIQCIGAGFVPEVLDTEIYDEVIKISNDESFEVARATAKSTGIIGGISSGVAIDTAKKVTKQLCKGKKVLAVLPDSGERYLSTPLYQYDD